jgi:hypothetical protein
MKYQIYVEHAQHWLVVTLENHWFKQQTTDLRQAMFPSREIRHCSSTTEAGETKLKGKVVPVLPVTEHHAMKAYWGSAGTAPPIL